MPRYRQTYKWYQTWYGLLAILIFVIIGVLLILWLISLIGNGIQMNPDLAKWVGIGFGIFAFIIIVALIFSEGFRSFILRIFGG